MADDRDPLIPPHGGYRELQSFQVARLVYDLTVRFCDHSIAPRSRTHDQMVQAARPGVQNIAEGSKASGTSKKTELKLTNVARASLEELRLDYEDFLRQRGLAEWSREDPRRQELVDRRCTTLPEVGDRVRGVYRRERSGPCEQRGHSGHLGPDTMSSASSASSSSTPATYPEIAANTALVLITVTTYLLDRQLAAQAAAFERKGGFAERLYHRRNGRRP